MSTKGLGLIQRQRRLPWRPLRSTAAGQAPKPGSVKVGTKRPTAPALPSPHLPPKRDAEGVGVLRHDGLSHVGRRGRRRNARLLAVGAPVQRGRQQRQRRRQRGAALPARARARARVGGGGGLDAASFIFSAANDQRKYSTLRCVRVLIAGGLQTQGVQQSPPPQRHVTFRRDNEDGARAKRRCKAQSAAAMQSTPGHAAAHHLAPQRSTTRGAAWQRGRAGPPRRTCESRAAAASSPPPPRASGPTPATAVVRGAPACGPPPARRWPAALGPRARCAAGAGGGRRVGCAWIRAWVWERQKGLRTDWPGLGSSELSATVRSEESCGVLRNARSTRQRASVRESRRPRHSPASPHPRLRILGHQRRRRRGGRGGGRSRGGRGAALGAAPEGHKCEVRAAAVVAHAGAHVLSLDAHADLWRGVRGWEGG
jgi:hypothetical protein